MFQRLYGVIDSRIAEEQARQRASQASPSRSNSGNNRSSSRNISPSKRALRSQARERKDSEPSARGLDPSEFESELILDGEDVPSRSGTPKPMPRSDGTATESEPSKEEPSEMKGVGKEDRTLVAEGILSSQGLPTDVRVKLRKLDKLESKYHELLKSYRLAHARALSVEAFETSLRENTPLTSITDPAALIEYLNQLNLKGDLVLNELKQVSSERDKAKEGLLQAKQNAKDAWDEVAKLRKQGEAIGLAEVSGRRSLGSQSRDDNSPGLVEEDPLSATLKSSLTSTKPRAGSITSMSLFSPRLKPVETPRIQEDKEDFFSYDRELPRLETELNERQKKIDQLQAEVETLKGDLAVARESTQSMVETLEESSRELHALRERRDRLNDESLEKQMSAEKASNQLRADLAASAEEFQGFKAEHLKCNPNTIIELERRLKETQETLDNLRAEASPTNDESSQVKQLTLKIEKMEKEMIEMSSSETNNEHNNKKMNALNGLVSNLRTQILSAEEEKIKLIADVSSEEKIKNQLREQVLQLESKLGSIHQMEDLEPFNHELPKPLPHPSEQAANGAAITLDSNSTAKKRNKKKKKGAKSTFPNDKDSLPPFAQGQTKSVDTEVSMNSQELESQLQEELTRLHELLGEKEIMVEKMHGKLKKQDDLHEEIETLRDDLIHVGQEHVEAKDMIKTLLEEKTALELTVHELEKELSDVRGTHASSTAGSAQKQEDLSNQFEDLKSKTTTLQTDLSAAQQLASTRFKDLSEMKAIFQKAQPELIALRSEAGEYKIIKETLLKKEAELQRLDVKHEEMRAEMAKLKQRIAERDLEIKSLNLKVSQETNSRLTVEDTNSKMNQEVQRLEIERRQASETLDKLAKDLSRSRDDVAALNANIRDLDLRYSKTNRENQSLKEEIDLKTAQYVSAQSLMGSMRDQTAEMAIQMKEARDRCDSLDEEVIEAHRLLSERSREGETMRKILADVEARADVKTREMKERMDIAIEERDRAEDEASTAARRKARELEDLRNKIREIERSLKRAEEDKEELELAQRDWKRRREELEQKSERHEQEVEDCRHAMGELRDALDERERQARELEKQKAEMRRSVEEAQHQLEKLQKSNKSMTDEMRTIQSAKTKVMDSETQSSRSSSEVTPAQARRSSPVSKGRNSTLAMMDVHNGQAPSSIDYVYLKNVLLQFLEQKDKKHQMQLIPVLGMLLHFDRKDEQKWMSTITAK